MVFLFFTCWLLLYVLTHILLNLHLYQEALYLYIHIYYLLIICIYVWAFQLFFPPQKVSPTHKLLVYIYTPSLFENFLLFFWNYPISHLRQNSRFELVVSGKGIRQVCFVNTRAHFVMKMSRAFLGYHDLFNKIPSLSWPRKSREDKDWQTVWNFPSSHIPPPPPPPPTLPFSGTFQPKQYFFQNTIYTHSLSYTLHCVCVDILCGVVVVVCCVTQFEKKTPPKLRGVGDWW